MESQPLIIRYWAEKDILHLEIPPRRPSRWDGNRLDFFVCYDWDRPNEIVGFEILDFQQRFVPRLSDPDAIPSFVRAMRFDVVAANLKSADLVAVLLWASTTLCEGKVVAAP